MSQPVTKLATRKSLIVDAILLIGFYAFMFGVLKSHVPSENPLFVNGIAGAVTACMTGVFWLAVQMFRVVLSAQLANRKK